MIVHAKIMCDQMINVISHNSVDALLFHFRVGDQIIVECIEEIVPVEFVGAGVGFPVVTAVFGHGPARFKDAPQAVARRMRPALAFERVAGTLIRVRFRSGNHRSGNEACGCRMRSATWCNAQETQRLECLFRPASGLRVPRGRPGAAFPGAVDRGPKAVIIAVVALQAGFVTRSFGVTFDDETEFGAAVVQLNFLFEKTAFSFKVIGLK